MERNNPPAILRSYCDADRDASIITTIYDTVSFTRGLGSCGYRIQTVEHDCPQCGFDRMIRKQGVNPEERDRMRYHCLNPNCGHFVGDKYNYATGRPKNAPTIIEEA